MAELIVRRLLALFLLVPVIEIVLLIRAGEALGTGRTLALLALGVLLGVGLIALQGLYVRRYLETVRRTQTLPEFPIWNRLALALAGMLLIFPGFFTDLLAVLLMLKPLRAGLYRLLRDRGRRPPPGGPPAGGGRTLEGEFRKEDR